MLLFSLPALLSLPWAGASSAPRSGAPVPVWTPGDAWSYHTDDKSLDAYGVIMVQIPDPKTGLPVDTILCNYPTSRSIDDQYTLFEKGSTDYNMTVWENITETGTWIMRKLVAGQARCDAGDTVYKGTYNRTDNDSGSELMRVSNLNDDGNFLLTNSSTVYDGDLYFIITIDSVYDTTVDVPCKDWKPDWDSAPMNANDGWREQCTQTQVYSEFWSAQGNLVGDFTDGGTYHFIYDMNWTVPSMSSQTVMDDTFSQSYSLQGQGTVIWDWQDLGGHTDNGKGSVQTQKWYADQGNYWDAGWAISYDSSKFLLWSTYGPPIDWNNPPQVTKAPPTEIDINVGEAWEFSDYSVKDTDPGACGAAGFVYNINATYDGKGVLPGLKIDKYGVLTYTPKQVDAADGYALKITVSDSCPGSSQKVDIPFTLNIKNLNHSPTADLSVMYDLWLNEGNFTVTDWSLHQVFSDLDMQKSPLTGKAYDPQEHLVYSVTNNGTMWVDLDKTTGNVTFTAQDKQFPQNQNFSLLFTATDRFGAKASDGMIVHVMHRDHLPYTISGKPTITIDEDTSTTLDFKHYFADYDVSNPNYITSDRLYYYAWVRANISVENKGELFKLIPWANWSGQETVHLRAADTWGGYAQTDITLAVDPVNDPPTIYFQTPDKTEGVITMDEPPDPNYGGGHDYPRTVVLSVTAMDIDNSELVYNWTVQDPDTGDVYAWSVGSNASMMTFATAFKGAFTDGAFTGGKGTKEYLVEVTVSDGQYTVKGGSWDLLVYNIDRIPKLQGLGVNLNRNGLMTGVLEDDYLNYSLGYGNKYQITVNGLIYDADTALSDLECRWDIDGGKETFSGKCTDWGAINVSTGSGKGTALARLKSGPHIIKINVTDDLGASTELQVYLKVGKAPPTWMDKVTANSLLIAFAVGLIISMFFVGFLLAIYSGKRSAPAKPDQRKGPVPKITPKAPYLPPGKVPKKVVRKKVAPKTEPEVTQVGSLRIKKVPKRSHEEEIPDDWK